MPLPPITFTGICVHSPDKFHLSAVIDELASDNVDHTVLLTYDDGKWESGMFSTHICGLVLPNADAPDLMCVSVDGDVHILSKDGKSKHQIDTSENGPSHLVQLKVVQRIGASVFAAGMARRVYRLESDGGWSAVDENVFVPRSQRTEPCGFWALAGNSETDMCAAGLRGELWIHNDTGWQQQESPTNVALTSSATMTNGEFCVAGLVGTVLCGRADSWRVVEHETTAKDFWGCATFAESTYLATYDGIYRLNDDQSELVPIDLAPVSNPSTALLHASGGTLWSVGQKDLIFTRDGIEWQRVVPQTD